MTALYIDRRDARLDYDSGQLRIYEADRAPRGFPITQLERIVIAGNTQIETRLLTQLADQGASVLLLGGRGGSRLAQVHGYRHGDASRRLGQYRLCTTPALRLRWARLIVRLRARGAQRLLAEALQLRPDCRNPLTTAQRQIGGMLPGVRQRGDLASLRGSEGAIGAAYFSAYSSLFAPSLDFNTRTRRPPRDPVNSALSLGYTLTHADAVRACHLAGLDPLLGIYHETAHGRESLACDFNELARVDVERMVWRLFAEKQLRGEGFEVHAGGVFMKKDTRHSFYAAYEQMAAGHRRRLRTIAAALARECNRLWSEPEAAAEEAHP